MALDQALDPMPCRPSPTPTLTLTLTLSLSLSLSLSQCLDHLIVILT